MSGKLLRKPCKAARQLFYITASVCHRIVVLLLLLVPRKMCLFSFKPKLRRFPCYGTGMDFFCMHVRWVKL